MKAAKTKRLYQCIVVVLGVALGGSLYGQELPTDIYRFDTIECHIVGFNVGMLMPSEHASKVTFANGDVSRNATMHSLYQSPWLNFGINGYYKYKSNWMVIVEGDLWFGNDNLQHRTERMSDIYTDEGLIIATNGTDAVVTAYNRALAAKAGVGKIIPLWPSLNPNSGLYLSLTGGWMLQQTIFMLNEEKAPQVDGDYALLYDHQRQGAMLTEGIGFWFMSNRANLINFHISFEISQIWSRSTRECVIDNYLGQYGKDNNHYFDLMYALKVCWMFPLKGKTTKEYYYY